MLVSGAHKSAPTEHGSGAAATPAGDGCPHQSANQRSQDIALADAEWAAALQAPLNGPPYPTDHTRPTGERGKPSGDYCPKEPGVTPTKLPTGNARTCANSWPQ